MTEWIAAWPQGPRRWGSIILTAAVLVVFLPLTHVAPWFWRWVFCMPAALLSGSFMGVSPLPTSEGIMLPHPALPVQVTPQCSAASFFMLITAMSLGLFYGDKRVTASSCFVIIALCYGTTIVANTTRIVLGWLTGMAARAMFPENFWHAIHTGVGVFVFLIFLVATHGFIRWRLHHARQR